MGVGELLHLASVFCDVRLHTHRTSCAQRGQSACRPRPAESSSLYLHLLFFDCASECHYQRAICSQSIHHDARVNAKYLCSVRALQSIVVSKGWFPALLIKRRKCTLSAIARSARGQLPFQHEGDSLIHAHVLSIENPPRVCAWYLMQSNVNGVEGVLTAGIHHSPCFSPSRPLSVLIQVMIPANGFTLHEANFTSRHVNLFIPKC